MRIRTRGAREGDAPRASTLPVRRALAEAEGRFLSLQGSRTTSDTIQVLSDYLRLADDLAGIDAYLEESGSRRDIPFVTDRRIHLLRDYGRWLVRRVSAELVLVLQVHMEQELRGIIGPEAYQLFLRFEEVRDAVREIEMLSDDDLMARLRGNVLFRDVLQRARLGEILDRESSWQHHVPPR